jgi:hypothetical protein
MELVVFLIIVMTAVIVLALALYLTVTIIALIKIHDGLNLTLDAVGEIAAKTAPVNGVLDAINGTLIAGCNLLEGLFLKKAGNDAAGLVESSFPGEGQRFLQRVGRRGPVVPIGETYPRGEAILGSLLGSPPPAAAAAEPEPVGRMSAMGSRPWER